MELQSSGAGGFSSKLTHMVVGKSHLLTGMLAGDLGSVPCGPFYRLPK